MSDALPLTEPWRVPTADLLPGAVLDAVRAGAGWARRRGRLHPDVLAALTASGLLGTPSPDGSARDLVAAVSALGRADGAAAWVVGEHRTAAWVLDRFPAPPVPDGPDARLAAALGPGGVLHRDGAGDGVLSGSWPAVCGARDARWLVAVATARTPDDLPAPVAVVVATAALELHEHRDEVPAPGLHGAGRVRVTADRVPVPAARVLPLRALTAPAAVAGSREAPLPVVAALPTVAALVGRGRAALDLALAAAPGAGGYAALVTAAERIDGAARLVDDLAGEVDRRGRAAAVWTVTDRAVARGVLDRVVDGVQRAVADLAAVGDPAAESLQEVLRDVRAVDRYGLAVVPGGHDHFARALCGLHQ